MNNNFRLPMLVFSFLTIFPLKVNSQIIPDTTVDTQVEQNANTAEITGGETRGSNLFHSFQEFSIQTGNEAFFNNAADISNIFSRITGENISNIDGLIRANGNANLFLINPNGIIFGENARLDIGGSFLATTAETINFPDAQFSTATPEQPILTNTIPIGLGFGSNSGDITIQGQQNNVVIEIPSFRIITQDLPEGIQVNPQENISLIGGNINFTGGGLQAPGGNIELGSVGDNQIVNLLEIDGKFQANFENIANFKDITFENAAYIDVSSEIAGNINLNGRQILVQEGSAILANTSSSSQNAININASDRVELSGSSGLNDFDSSLAQIREIARDIDSNSTISDFGSPTNIDSNFYSISLIGADIASNSGGIGNNININTGNLTLLDAAQIRVGNFSDSPSTAGNINLNAQNILVEGTNNIDGFINSEITATTGIEGIGNGGSIQIFSQSLTVKDGGQISTDSFGSGSAGNLEVNSNDIQLQGFNPFPGNTSSTGFIGVASISTLPDSNGASIVVETQNLDILDGAKISVSSFGLGTPGSVEIDAEEINIDTGIGTSGTDNNFSGITASVNPANDLPNRRNLFSESGDIIIDTNSLKILNGARIEADTSAGNSGNININAQNIELNGTRPRVGNFIGGISTSTNPRAFGNGGNINIDTDSLTVANGSIIRAISLGSGDAGNIDIDAQKIKVFGFDRFAPEPISPQRISKINTGALRANGGNIDINSDSIELDNLGEIQASTLGEGLGGNIFLKTDEISLQNQANIAANAMTGNGGNIAINSDRFLTLDNSTITASAVEGNGGNTSINTTSLFAKNNSTITANAVRGNGGNIQVDTQGFFLFPDSSVTASSEFGIDGTVEIDDLGVNLQRDLEDSEQNFISTEKLISNSCLVRRNQNQRSLTISNLSDLINHERANFFDTPPITGLNNFSDSSAVNLPEFLPQSVISMIPAQKVVKTDDGRILMVAHPSSAKSLNCN